MKPPDRVVFRSVKNVKDCNWMQDTGSIVHVLGLNRNSRAAGPACCDRRPEPWPQQTVSLAAVLLFVSSTMNVEM